MDPALRLQPGKPELTPVQQAEARRFIEAYLQGQFSTEPVDEPEVESFLRQAYRVAGLAPPQRIQWVDSPPHLVEVLTAKSELDLDEVLFDVWQIVQDRLWANLRANIGDSTWESVKDSIYASLWESLRNSFSHVLVDRVMEGIWDTLFESAEEGARMALGRVWEYHESNESVVVAYLHAHYFALARFFDVYLAPNELHALAHFNERVSGYWLESQAASIVRRPRVLSRDTEGRLHSATGRCLEYRDGWGFYAWHGVRVPERVVLAPETLTREDFLQEPNVEVRRVMQERMGSRFVSELDGQVIDTSPRGTLYEVCLPASDPERVARYVQVQDASTQRQYFLRVPPTLQTAAEAVAWTFQIGVDDYRPAQET